MTNLFFALQNKKKNLDKGVHMQKNSQKSQTGKTAADKAMDKFVSWIADEMYTNYGLGTRENSIDGHEAQILAWRSLHTWSKEKEDFVIKYAKLFIRLLNPNDSNSTNLMFIKALVNRMAAYLSLFLERGPNRTRNQTQKILKMALYDDNEYIRNLESHQKNKRAVKQPRTPQAVAARRKRERIDARQKKRELENQIQVLFVEVATYRKR